MQQITWPVIALALMAAACDNPGTVRITTSSTSDSSGVLKVVDALQCPQTQGVLTRKGSARADGSCVYGGPRGSEVILQLVQLDGRSSTEALKSFENRLTSDLPEAVAEVEAENARVEAEAARAEADAARAEADASRAAAEAEAAAGDSAQVRMPGLRVDAQGDKATVRLPGMKIEADGDRANIRIGGLTIRADDKSSRVNVSSGDDTVNIDATDGAARIRTSGSGEAVRATFLMTGKEASASGWRTVGYEARGPVGGPIVVATVRSKDRDPDRLFDAAKALVTLNVGD